MALPVVRRRDNAPSILNGDWDPFAELERLAQQMRSWLQGEHWSLFDSSFVPGAEVEELEDAYLVEIDLPGVSKGDLNVELSGRRLVVSGERKAKESSGVLRGRTRRTGQFRYEVVLPGELDPDGVEATMEDGILSIRLPKAAGDRPRRVSIK
jgi:HSP20 family protein